MANVAKDFAQLISQSKSNKTGPYDTQATVKRVEGNTVWVSIPGGVDETPVDKTVNCTAGDKVQVRVSGGRAWITGNASAPPTDDKTANEAKTKAVVAEATAIDAKETADAVEGIAANASTTAVTAKTIAEGVNEHFWHDSTGAHVTEVTQEEWNDPADPNYHSGGNTLITTQGMAIRNGLTNLAEFGATGATIGVSGSQIAHLGYGPGANGQGSTSNAPYYTLGVRTGNIGNYSTAEGYNNTASEICAHAEGELTKAKARYSHAQGYKTSTEGETLNIGVTNQYGGHAGGEGSKAYGANASAHGYNVIAHTGQFVIGVGNIEATSNDTVVHDEILVPRYIFVIGNGDWNGYGPSNAFTVDWSGNVEAAGSITVDGHTQEIGFFGRSAGSYSCTSNTNYHNTGYNTPATSDADCLSAGTWLLVAHVTFPSNNTGRRTIRIYNVTTSSEIGRSVVTRTATQGATTQMIATCIIQITAKNQYRVDIMQNSGSTASCDIDFTWTRIA